MDKFGNALAALVAGAIVAVVVSGLFWVVVKILADL